MRQKIILFVSIFSFTSFLFLCSLCFGTRSRLSANDGSVYQRKSLPEKSISRIGHILLSVLFLSGYALSHYLSKHNFAQKNLHNSQLRRRDQAVFVTSTFVHMPKKGMKKPAIQAKFL